jgi:hypothetical protein
MRTYRLCFFDEDIVRGRFDFQAYDDGRALGAARSGTRDFRAARRPGPTRLYGPYFVGQIARGSSMTIRLIVFAVVACFVIQATMR